MLSRRFVCACAAVLFGFSSAALAQIKYSGDGGVPLDVPYVPTSQEVVNRMLEIAKAGPNDIHYDLGSGDGRIVVTAARDFKVKKGVGVDLDPVRIREATQNAKEAGVADRVKFFQTDLFQFDFSEASVLTLYLLPDVNLLLRPIILDKMKPGTRVVSHAFTMGDWEADLHETVSGEQLYHWVVPAKVDGMWTWTIGADTYRLELGQKFQKVTGRLHSPTGFSNITETKLEGDQLRFQATVERGGLPVVLRFNGVVKDTLTGMVSFAGMNPTNITATRQAKK